MRCSDATHSSLHEMGATYCKDMDLDVPLRESVPAPSLRLQAEGDDENIHILALDADNVVMQRVGEKI